MSPPWRPLVLRHRTNYEVRKKKKVVSGYRIFIFLIPTQKYNGYYYVLYDHRVPPLKHADTTLVNKTLYVPAPPSQASSMHDHSFCFREYNLFTSPLLSYHFGCCNRPSTVLSRSLSSAGVAHLQKKKNVDQLWRWQWQRGSIQFFRRGRRRKAGSTPPPSPPTLLVH